MTSMKFTADTRAVRAAFARMRRAGLQPRPALLAIAEHLQRSHRDRWRRGIGPDGRPWAPLRPSTLSAKRGRFPLYEEGDMLRGLVTRASGKRLVFGISDWKAPLHHFGTEPYTITPRKKKALAWPGGPGPRRRVDHPGLPARPLVGISASDRREIVEIIEDYLVSSGQ